MPTPIKNISKEIPIEVKKIQQDFYQFIQDQLRDGFKPEFEAAARKTLDKRDLRASGNLHRDLGNGEVEGLNGNEVARYELTLELYAFFLNLAPVRGFASRPSPEYVKSLATWVKTIGVDKFKLPTYTLKDGTKKTRSFKTAEAKIKSLAAAIGYSRIQSRKGFGFGANEKTRRPGKAFISYQLSGNKSEPLNDFEDIILQAMGEAITESMKTLDGAEVDLLQKFI